LKRHECIEIEVVSHGCIKDALSLFADSDIVNHFAEQGYVSPENPCESGQ
jgi:hypothetical protein